MTISLDSIPRFTAAEALAVAAKDYGIDGEVSPLPSERDQNFLISNLRGDKFVLKIANRNDAPQLLEFQDEAMRRVAASPTDCRVQSIVRTRAGADIASIAGAAGAWHWVRVLTWMEGEVLAAQRRSL
jgi:Ser/Thr protein kinase RdoA (MazF antagonist)